MDSGLLSLKWNHHNVSFQNMLSNIRSKVLFSDVTLACGGKLYQVHKLVLSTCSEYFEVMLQETHCKHPVIVLKDISCADLDYLLDFMYIGEVNVPQTKLSGLIEAAECLRIRGLAVPDESEQDIIVKGAPLRNEKSNVNSHMRNKRLREESPETPHKKGQRSDHAKHTKFSGVERNNNGHKSTVMTFTDHDSPRTEKSTSDKTHMKHRNATSSVMDNAPINIKEELDNSPLEDHIIALQNESIEDIPNLEKKSEPNTLGCTVSEANNRHGKSPAIGSSSLDFKEDMSQEFSSFDERSNGHQLTVSGDDDELQSLSFPSPPPQPPYHRDGAIPSSLHEPLDDFSPFLPHQQHIHPFCGDLSQLHNSQAASACTASSLGFLADDAVQSFAGLSTPFGSAQSSAGANTTSTSLGSLTTMPYIKLGRGPDSFKQCPFCPYKTQLTGNIKKHILGHTGCKPFACNMCSYRTNEKSNLNRHVRCHLVKATQIKGDLKPSDEA